MKIGGAWMAHPGTQGLCAALETAGHRALFVGGCVRNSVIGAPVADVDIATDATPQNVTNIAETAGFRVIPTGIDHGTVTVIADGRPHEVTTFRRDVQTDGRHAVVAFSTDIAEDASRRDFTMNALYADRLGRVVDPLSGLPDLLARRVRFVGDAEARIREDYLRILRFFRFHAYYGDPEQGIDDEGLAACAANLAGLGALSAERVGAEFRKLLNAPDPAPAVWSMAAAGVLALVLPGSDLQALAPLVHLEASTPPRWQRRLAVIGGDQVASRLRLSRAESNEISLVRDAIASALTPAALGFLHGEQIAQDAILARAAVFGVTPPENWRTDVRRGAEAICPVTASDLMPGLQGPSLGLRLKEIEAAWLASDLMLSRDELLA